MKFLLAVLLLLLTVTPGTAQTDRWQALDFDRDGDTIRITSIDTTTIQRTGSRVVVWLRQSLSLPRIMPWNGMAYDAVTQRWTVSCNDRTLLIHSASYRLNGAHVYTSANSVASDVEPDTVGEVVYEKVCTKGGP